MLDLLISHIKKWRMVWFGFLFIGSILNAFVEQVEVLENSPYLTFCCFFIGFIIGLVAKVRGKWLWN